MNASMQEVEVYPEFGSKYRNKRRRNFCCFNICSLFKMPSEKSFSAILNLGFILQLLQIFFWNFRSCRQQLLQAPYFGKSRSLV